MDSRQAKDALFEAIALMGKAFASPRRLELLDLLAQAPRRSRSSRAPAASRAPIPRSTCRRSTLPAWSPASARATACATRSPAKTCSRSGSRCETSRRPAWPRSSGRRATTWARTSRRSAARSWWPGSPGRRRARRRAARRGVRCRPHRGCPLDPAGRARAPPCRAAGRREIVAYCRGPFCAYAHEAVRRLRDAGRAARRLEDGWPEWQLAARASEAPTDEGGSSMSTTTNARHQRARRARQAHVRGGGARARARVPLRDRPAARRAARLPGGATSTASRQARSSRSPASATSSTSPRSGRRRRARPRQRLGHGQLPRRARSGRRGRVIGVDMTDEQLAKARTACRRGRLRERRVPPGLHRAARPSRTRRSTA